MKNEPVAWMDKRTNKCVVFINTPPSDDWIPLYTHPHPDNLGLAESIIKQQQAEIEALKVKAHEWYLIAMEKAQE